MSQNQILLVAQTQGCRQQITQRIAFRPGWPLIGSFFHLGATPASRIWFLLDTPWLLGARYGMDTQAGIASISNSCLDWFEFSLQAFHVQFQQVIKFSVITQTRTRVVWCSLVREASHTDAQNTVAKGLWRSKNAMWQPSNLQSRPRRSVLLAGLRSGVQPIINRKLSSYFSRSVRIRRVPLRPPLPKKHMQCPTLARS